MIIGQRQHGAARLTVVKERGKLYMVIVLLAEDGKCIFSEKIAIEDEMLRVWNGVMGWNDNEVARLVDGLQAAIRPYNANQDITHPDNKAIIDDFFQELAAMDQERKA